MRSVTTKAEQLILLSLAVASSINTFIIPTRAGHQSSAKETITAGPSLRAAAYLDTPDFEG
jgi:hypothetical protein